MKKISTPFAFILILIVIYSLNVLSTDEWGIVFILYIGVPSALLIFIFDLVLRKHVKSQIKIFQIQILLIAIGVGIYLYGKRVKTLEIQSNFNSKFISIVYEVDNEKELGISMFQWWKTIEIPNDGILFTSSDFNENLPVTKIKFKNGTYLGSDETNLHFGEMDESRIIINRKEYKYRTWTLQKGYCCIFPIEDKKTVQNNLKTRLMPKKGSR